MNFIAMFNAQIEMQGPFYSEKAGLSFIAFGELLQTTRELGPGRYPCQNGRNETFHLILYQDFSWRISTPQLEIFPDTFCDDETQSLRGNPPHTLT